MQIIRASQAHDEAGQIWAMPRKRRARLRAEMTDEQLKEYLEQLRAMPPRNQATP